MGKMVPWVRKLNGGISAIAISHPHYYSSMVEWSRALGDLPIYLHAADKQWVMRPDKAIVFWEGDTRALGEAQRNDFGRALQPLLEASAHVANEDLTVAAVDRGIKDVVALPI